MAVKIYVEGGGKDSSLRTSCRRAFSSFIKKAGMEGIMPRIVACGSREEAYADYVQAINVGEKALLLVDSEAPVIWPEAGYQGFNESDLKTWKPWYHLKNRKNNEGKIVDNWDMPNGGADIECHLMVECMETWFLADCGALQKYYGQKFNGNALPKRSDVENLSKQEVFSALANATRNSNKGEYNKGKHSFDLLETIDPQNVMRQSPWADRFVTILGEVMRGAE